MAGDKLMDAISSITITKYINITRQSGAPGVVFIPRQEETPGRNNRCLNACVLLGIYAIGIAAIVLGAIHLNDCPAEKMLPMGLIIFGALMMTARILNIVYDFRSICEEESPGNISPCIALLNILFLLAQFGMFIALCVWAFSINPTTKPEDRELKNYCDYSIYNTCFYGCIVGIILYTLPIFCICCIAVCRPS